MNRNIAHRFLRFLVIFDNALALRRFFFLRVLRSLIIVTDCRFVQLAEPRQLRCDSDSDRRALLPPVRVEVEIETRVDFEHHGFRRYRADFESILLQVAQHYLLLTLVLVKVLGKVSGAHAGGVDVESFVLDMSAAAREDPQVTHSRMTRETMVTDRLTFVIAFVVLAFVIVFVLFVFAVLRPPVAVAASKNGALRHDDPFFLQRVR